MYGGKGGFKKIKNNKIKFAHPPILFANQNENLNIKFIWPYILIFKVTSLILGLKF